MIALLKWTTVAYLGVLGVTAVSFAMYSVCKPVAIIVLGALTPVLLPPILFVAAAIAIYLWLLVLIYLSRYQAAWDSFSRTRPSQS